MNFLVWVTTKYLVARPNTKEIKRFLVGPKECEITGLTWSGDKKNDVCWYSTSRRIIWQ